MADKKKSLSDLGAVLNPTPEAPPETALTDSVATEKTIAADAPAGDVAVAEADAPAAPVNIQPEAPLREQQLDKFGRAYATGRRKDAVARVWLKPGSGKITVNGRDQEVYFARPTLRLVINHVALAWTMAMVAVLYARVMEAMPVSHPSRQRSAAAPHPQ